MLKRFAKKLTFSHMKGTGGVYVVLILGLVSGLSYLLTGGLTPSIERNPENPEYVEIEDQLTPVAQQNLQMQNIQIKQPTPFPTIQAGVCPNNLIANGSFEADSVGANPPSGWSGSGSVTAATLYQIPDGSRYAALTGNQVMTQNVPVTPETTYTLSFYSTSHNPSTQTVRVQYFTSSNTAIGAGVIHTVTHNVNSTNSFGGPYTLSIPQAPATASYLRISVADNGEDYIKVDYFCLQEGDGATLSPAPGDDTPTGSITPTGNLSPSPGVSQSPTPSIPLQACLDQTAVALLIDLSYSMGEPSSKMSALNSALDLLNSRLRDNTVVGAYAFGPYPDYNGNGDISFNYQGNGGVKQIFPFRRYIENKATIDSQLGGLSRGGIGGTYMRNGFEVMIEKIQEAKQTYPGYNFVTILLSDGVPELGDDDPVVKEYWNRGQGFPTVVCFGNKCFAKNQDPRAWSDIGTSNLITPLKNASKDRVIYTIAIYGTVWPDTQFKPYLEDLLTEVAGSSSSPAYQFIDNTNYTQLSTFFNRILDDSCS